MKGMGRTAVVGLVIVIALAILAGSILMIGSESRMFSRKAHYATNFADALGLRVGSPVYMSGVQIGGIESLVLPTDPKREGIAVRIAVDRDYAGRIREGTTASLAFLQVLSGDKLVLLSPGDPAKPPLAQGAVIPPAEGGGFLEAGASAAQDISEITSKLNDILDTINRGEGILGKMLRDPKFGEEGLKNINDTFVEAKSALAEIRAGQGLTGRLISDKAYAREVLDGLNQTVARMNTVLGRIEANEGAIGALLEEGGEGEQLIADLRETSKGMNATIADIRAGKGLLGRMIYDEDLSRTVADDLKRSSRSLASILEKIDKGEGSLGGLVNDPAVYQGLQDIVGGINKSRIGKAFLHHYQKKGEAAREEGMADADGTAATGPGR